MKELNSILRAHPGHARLPDLLLPRFDNRSIKVHPSESRNSQSPDDLSLLSSRLTLCIPLQVLLNDHMQRSGFAPADTLSGVHPLWQARARPFTTSPTTPPPSHTHLPR